MARQLLLLRHAKSAWDTPATSDFDRPLAKRGRAEAPLVGEWLAQNDLVPALVISSTAQRARETALLVCEAMDYKKKHILWEDDIYMAEVPALLEVLADCPDKANSVMLIGHNPGLEELLRYLLGDEVETPPDGKLLPTATVARLEMPKKWDKLEPGCARLIEIQRPGRGS